MANFYIKKLIVTGIGKEPSVLEFKEGLNIICGPSNTGKSYVAECFDFMFGSKKFRFDRISGYNCVKMIVSTKNGSITLERKLDTNNITVHSTDYTIESGKYGINGEKNNISDLWLRLIDVEDTHYIIKNARFEKQRLTWRTFLHMFLIKETNIFQESSIIIPKQNTATPAALAALLFLITGMDFADADPREEKKIKEARKKAVVDYINHRLFNFAERKKELYDLPVSDTANIQNKVEDIIDEIAETEAKIVVASQQSKELLNETYSINSQLAECNTLYNRYQSLKSQYASDIKRLTFIVEGEINRDGMPSNSKCPFCEGDITAQKDPSYIEASHAELHRIQLQLSDLSEAEHDLVTERATLEKQISILDEKRSEVEALLNYELKPKVSALKLTLSEFRRAIEIENEATVISGFEKSMKTELFEAMTEEDSNIEFKVKNYFDRSILDDLDKYLNKILKLCNNDEFSSVYLTLNSFDVVIDGKHKDSFGKGYRAFLNTMLAIALMEYLVGKGKFAPGLLIVDSPILSLKERGDEKASDTMKSALFQYLLNNQNNGQVIIIENDIPSLDYGNARVIRFTKDINSGRYGFLNDVR